MFNEVNVLEQLAGGEVTAGAHRQLYIESYGCQMNFSDSEIVASILKAGGCETTANIDNADIVFLNTCAIRDNAEQRIWKRLKELKNARQKNPGLIIGVLGCMAERLKHKLLEEEKLVDIVAGPDSYRDLPNLIKTVDAGQKAVNVLLSRDETYAGINPVRLSSNGITAFISIMRGCDNMCSFCVVPFTRGRERSRDPQSIINEARELFNNGYREVTLLGQNVDSYLWNGGGQKKDLSPELVHAALSHMLPGHEQNQFVTFANLLELVAQVHPGLRVRFSTSNPRDMTDAVLHAMNRHANICKYIHLPMQSGNSRVLEKMNRGYTRQDYIKHIDAIKNIIPGCAISTDIIAGFCSEEDEEHRDTLSMMDYVQYDYAFMFKYSERPGTAAARKYADDISDEVKTKRLQEIIKAQNGHSLLRNKQAVGKVHRVLIEGYSKRSSEHLCGRNDQNKMIVFPAGNLKPGEYVDVYVTSCTAATLLGETV